MKFCNQCGAKLEDEMMFCMSCGAKQPSIETALADASAPAEAVAETVEETKEAVVEAVAAEETLAAETVAKAEETLAVEATAAVETVSEAVSEIASETESTVTETITEAEAVVADMEEEAGAAVVSTVQEAETAAMEAPVTIPSVAETISSMQPVLANPAQKEKKGKKGLLVGIISGAVVLLLVAAALLWFFLFRKETIDAKDIVKVIGYGPDGFGKVAVVIAEKDEMDTLINLDDDENPYMGLWSDLYHSVKNDDENYPDGLVTWVKENESEYFSSDDAWKKVKLSGKIDDAREALLDVKVSVDEDDADKDGTWSVGDTITIVVEADEDDLKKANVILKNTTFEYTFVEGDFVECTKINPFDGAKLICQGNEGNSSIFLDKSGIDTTVQSMFYYSFEQPAAIENGTRIKCKAEPYGNLSVGYLKWNDHYYKVDESDLEKVFTVSGLEEAKLIDPFEGIKVSYSGVNPELKIEIEGGNVCAYYGGYSYPEYTCKIGDSVEFTYTLNDYNGLLSKGYKVDSDCLTYTFVIPESAPHYVKEDTDFTKYNPYTMLRLGDEVEACIGTEELPGGIMIKKTIEDVADITYGGAKIFFGYDDEGNEANELYQYFEFTIVTNGTTETYYYICRAEYVYVDENGEFMCGTIEASIYDVGAGNQAEAAFDSLYAPEGVTMVEISR